MSPLDWIAAALIALGLAFMLLAALGVLRFPDFYTRVHASRLIGAIGAPMFLLGLALHALEPTSALKLAVLALVIVACAPFAAHLLASAAHGAGLTPISLSEARERRTPAKPPR
jgi:multicomponent Na+:H+ antiporter subunit G